jgi:predicted nucleic acid-binding protein
MADYYADSSVLVKRHVREAGSHWVQELCAPATGNVIITARITLAEVYSALNRRRREAHLTGADYTDLANEFNRVCIAEYQLVELTAPVIEQARTLLERYPLRAYDAVQLASALSAQAAFKSAGLPSLTFLAADNRLLDAARAEGLSMDNPNANP